MIKNQKQAGVTREKLEQLIIAKNNYVSTNDSFRDELNIKALDGLILELQYQLEEYDSLVSGNFHSLKAESLEEIPKILIAARLAKKLSQKELAERLGMKEQQIQRYEATDYETASWPRIVEIALALEIRFVLERVFILSPNNNFERPSGLTNEQVDVASSKIKQSKSLII